MLLWAPRVVLVVKNIPAHAGGIRDDGWIHGSGRSRKVGNGNPLHYSCLENLIDRGSLAGYSPWGHKLWDMTEHTAHICMLLIVLLFKKENKTRTQWSHTGARARAHTHTHTHTRVHVHKSFMTACTLLACLLYSPLIGQCLFMLAPLTEEASLIGIW